MTASVVPDEPANDVQIRRPRRNDPARNFADTEGKLLKTARTRIQSCGRSDWSGLSV